MNRLKWIAILGIIVGPCLAFFGMQESQKFARIEKEGVTVQGVIMKGESRSRKGSKSYKFDITYQPEGGASITKNFSVTNSFAQTKMDGNSITDPIAQVRYLPSDPQTAIVVNGTSNVGSGMMWAGIAWGIIGLITAFFSFVRRPA